MKYMIKKLALVTCIGMLLVLLMGTLVTKTESGRGCGDDWPLCNGKFVPSYTIESMIEYSHRFVTGVEGMLVLATFLAVLRYVRRTDALTYAGSTLFFTVLQAGMGAIAVVRPQSSGVLALHFGLSLLAFASTVLLVMALRGYEPQRTASAKPAADEAEAETAALPAGLRGFVWLAAAYCYAVVYIGAYVKHTDSGGGCSGWPLCNGQVVPELTGATGVVFMHRVAAMLLFILIAFLYNAIRKSGAQRLEGAAKLSLYFVAAQVISGGLVTYAMGTEGYLFAAMLHTILISGLFTSLSYLCALILSHKTAASAGRAVIPAPRRG